MDGTVLSHPEKSEQYADTYTHSQNATHNADFSDGTNFSYMKKISHYEEQ